MGFATDLLKFVVKVGLNLTIGSKLAKEAGQLYQQLQSRGDPAAREKDVAEAKAAKPEEIRRVVAEAVAQAKAGGDDVSAKEQQDLAKAVETNLAQLTIPVARGPEAIQELAEQVVQQMMPHRRGVYVIWTDSVEVLGEEGAGRYVHFSWNQDDSYRVRDFIGGRIVHQEGVAVQEDGLQPIASPLSAWDVWDASKARVRREEKYGLFFNVEELENRRAWRKKLILLTRVAELWRQAEGRH